MTKDLNGFLDELTELSKKYQIVIGGCGCCSSQYLWHIEMGNPTGNSIFAQFLNFDKNNNEYSASIVPPDEDIYGNARKLSAE